MHPKGSELSKLPRSHTRQGVAGMGTTLPQMRFHHAGRVGLQAKVPLSHWKIKVHFLQTLVWGLRCKPALCTSKTKVTSFFVTIGEDSMFSFLRKMSYPNTNKNVFDIPEKRDCGSNRNPLGSTVPTVTHFLNIRAWRKCKGYLSSGSQFFFQFRNYVSDIVFLMHPGQKQQVSLWHDFRSSTSLLPYLTSHTCHCA
jgi:hypothetical protein